MDTRNIKFKKK